MQSSKKTILIYGLAPMELLALSAMAEHAGVRCKPVSDVQTTLTISQLLSDNDYPPAPPFPLQGKFALLDGFTGNEDEGAALINYVAGGVIKAVHTKHNTNWRFSDLCAEIHAEHTYMTNNPN